jgi:hypothetical protein
LRGVFAFRGNALGRSNLHVLKENASSRSLPRDERGSAMTFLTLHHHHAALLLDFGITIK